MLMAHTIFEREKISKSCHPATCNHEISL